MFATSWSQWELMLDLPPVRATVGEAPRPRPERQHSRSLKLSSAGGVAVASVLTLVVIGYTSMTSDDAAPAASGPTAAPPRASSPAPSAVVAPPAPSQPVRPRPGGAIPMDERGFVGTAARCEGALTPVAVARTARALIAVCRLPDGRLTYDAVRSGDRAELHLANVTATPRGFVAQNDGSTYLVSPTELLVTSGATTLARDAMVEYRATAPERAR